MSITVANFIYPSTISNIRFGPKLGQITKKSQFPNDSDKTPSNINRR